MRDLSRISAQMNALQGEIDSLRQKIRDRDETVNLDTARLNGVDITWRRWTDATIARMQLKMAELALARELFVARTRTSFGRAAALDSLKSRKK